MPQGLAIATVDVSFPLLAPDGSAAAPSYSFASAPDAGMYYSGGYIGFSTSGVLNAQIASSYFVSTGRLYSRTDNGGLTIGAADDVIISRDAANVLALKNGTAAQEFRVYGTTTGARYLSLSHNGTVANIVSSYGDLYFGASAGIWHVEYSGMLAPFSTGLADLGQSSQRVRSIFLGGNTPAASAPMLDLAQTWNDAGQVFLASKIVITKTNAAAGSAFVEYYGGAAGTTLRFQVAETGTVYTPTGVVTDANGAYQISGRLALTASSDGVAVLYNAGFTDFSRLCFGGTTSSFPAWARSGAKLAARLADDSDDATVQAKSLLLMTGGIGWSGYTSVINQQIRLPTSGAIHWGNSSDTGFTWIAVRSIACGMDPSATPQAQAFTIGERSRGGTDTNVAGSNGTLRPGTGTGNAAGASLLFETPTPTASGSVQQSYAQRLSLSSLGATFDIPDQGLRINNQVNGAGASAGSLTNAPSAGNPNFWLPISIAGVTRYFPGW